MAFLTLGALGLTAPEQYRADCQSRLPKYASASAATYRPIYESYTSGRKRLDAAYSKLVSYQSEAMRLANKDPEAARALDEIESGLDAVQRASSALNLVKDEFQGALSGKYGCQIHYKRIGGKTAREWSAAMTAAASASLPPHGRILATLKAAKSRIQRVEFEQQQAHTKEQAAAQAASQAASQAAAREQQQQQLVYDRQAAEEGRLRMQEENRLAREEQARQAEAEFQRMQLEEQRRLRDLEYEREAQERARIAQIEQQRIDAEMRREQQAIAADERRMRIQETAALRAEEAALRRQEQEAQLQQLVMLQELASQGLPTHLIPAGLPTPAAQASRPAPQAAWSPYGLPIQPAPVQPALQPHVQQSEWGSFGPGAEKF